jgi:hypothetical protein
VGDFADAASRRGRTPPPEGVPGTPPIFTPSRRLGKAKAVRRPGGKSSAMTCRFATRQNKKGDMFLGTFSTKIEAKGDQIKKISDLPFYITGPKLRAGYLDKKFEMEREFDNPIPKESRNP